MGDHWAPGCGPHRWGSIAVSDVAVRLLVVVAVVVGAALIGLVIGRVRKPPHPGVTVGEVGERPGVVMFTSTTCPTCKDAIARLEDVGVPFREVTSDLEPQRFDTWGIVAVPVTVVLDGESSVVATFSGVPPVRQLRRAVSSAGIMLG